MVSTSVTSTTKYSAVHEPIAIAEDLLMNGEISAISSAYNREDTKTLLM